MGYLDTTLACSQGFLNALVFGFTQTVREVLWEQLGCRDQKARQEQEMADQRTISDESSLEDLGTSKVGRIENSSLATNLTLSVQPS